MSTAAPELPPIFPPQQQQQQQLEQQQQQQQAQQPNGETDIEVVALPPVDTVALEEKVLSSNELNAWS